MSSREFSDSALIDLCRSCPESQLIGGSKDGNRVLKVSDDLVVKFGPGVSGDEPSKSTTARRS